ncbi:MAG: hypothetical protein F6K32_23740, partial [Desertifilum sp. SIO1I2]|nr:hypothetical protein [Desertifilum sp. SIO1I2]
QINKSQHRNRDEAMKMLKARLYERELQKREDASIRIVLRSAFNLPGITSSRQ